MRIVCIGAHPDDCEVFAGGTAVKWARRGDAVLFVSMTRGDAGHHIMDRESLAARRHKEAQASAALAGVKCLVLGYPDGELEPTLDARKEVARVIRRWRADLVLTHRPEDYHPDHRNTSRLVQDAAFMVTVPLFCPDTPALETNPVFAYLHDPFTRPTPFRADAAVGVDEVMDVKWAMLDAMASQFYEWLPWLEGKLAQAPEDAAERHTWMRECWMPFLRAFTETGRVALAQRYGEAYAGGVEYAEVFEWCEYGRRPSDEEAESLFPR